MIGLENLPANIVKKYRIEFIQGFKDGEIITFRNAKKKWGVLARTSSDDYRIVLKPTYDSQVSYIKEKDILCVIESDYVRFKVIDGQAHGYYKRGQNHYTLYTTSGELIEKFLNIDAISFDKWGHAILIENSKYGLLDENYKLSTACEYDKIQAINQDFFIAKREEAGKFFYGIITEKNEVIGSFGLNAEIYQYIYLDQIIIHEDRRYAGVPLQYYTFNLKTKEKKALPFEEIIEAYEGYRYDERREIPKYRTITNIQDTIAPVQTDWVSITHAIGKWGLIYANGEILIPNIYDYLEEINAKYFLVAKGEVTFAYDEDRDELIAKNLKWGIIDEHSNTIVEIEYDWIKINEDKRVIANKGGTLLYDFKEHKPEWRVFGGESMVIDVELK